MTILIEIKSTQTRKRTINPKKEGARPFDIHEQTAWAHFVGRDGTPNPYPERITLTLDRDNPVPYAEGSYMLAPSSFYKGAFDQLEVSPRLVPAKRSQTQAA